MLSIDPGKHCCAIALLASDGHLLDLIWQPSLARIPVKLRSYGGPVVVEGQHGGAAPTVSMAAGMLVGQMLRRSGLYLVPAPTWTRCVPKEARQLASLLSMTERELEMLGAACPSKQHNLVDAIDLGRWALRQGDLSRWEWR
jgi:hypothetical protein